MYISVQYCTVQYSAIQYSTVLYTTVQRARYYSNDSVNPDWSVWIGLGQARRSLVSLNWPAPLLDADWLVILITPFLPRITTNMLHITYK
jgi:hypothetical protein